jgi:hypothetical protein
VSDAHDISGQARALTVLTPILERHESELTRHLNAIEGGERSPLSHVAGTHFARWVVIGDVIYEGEGRRDHLKLGQLLFSSSFDGPHEAYLERLRTGLGDAADEIWQHCCGYPGSDDPAAFAGYLQAHRVRSSLFFAAYGERTVEDVRRSLATRHAVVDFALRAQSMSAAELQAAFGQAFGP